MKVGEVARLLVHVNAFFGMPRIGTSRNVAIFTAIVVFVGGVARIEAAQRPNLVLFLADDCTYRDIGCYGGTHSITPAIDKMAAEGMRFTKCYQAAPMCSPTRHNLYNGMYPVRTGAYPNHTFAADTVKSMPHYLKRLGYRVALLGKGHIGPRAVYPFEYLGDKPKGADHIDMSVSAKFLSEVSESGEPFCLVVCSHQPHGPYTLGDRSLFDADTVPLRKNMVDTQLTRQEFVEYLAEVNFMDGQVATLLGQLKRNSLDANSLVVFLSEQGNSFPFSKWTCYEDGVKSAFVARWPGVIKPGSVSNALVEYNDILPTFISAAGGEIPDQLDGVSLLPILKNPSYTGKQYAFSMQTTRGVIKGSDYFGIRSVTDGRYRYICNLSPEVKFSNGVTVAKGLNHWWGSWLQKAKSDPEAAKLVNKYLTRPGEELYDLQVDPDNLTNLADDPEHQTLRKRMRQAVLDWMQRCGDKGLETELLAFQRMKQHRLKVAPKIGELAAASTAVGKLRKAMYVPGQALKAYIDVPCDGYYTFYKSNKKKLSTSLLIDNETVLPTDGQSRYGIVGLKRGLLRIEIVAGRSTNEGPGDIRWSGPNRLPKSLGTALLKKQAK